MDKSELIIESSHLQSKAGRAIQWVLTLFFWLLWGYMVMPLASPIIGLLDVDIQVSQHLDMELVISIVIMALVACISIIMSMLVWRYYNIFIYRNNQDSDWQLSSILRQDLAEYFGVNKTELDQWQYARALNIHLNEDGKIIDVKAQ